MTFTLAHIEQLKRDGKIPFKELTASEITSKAIEELTAHGARVRRVHNVAAYRKRKNQVESGWPDVEGYSSGGKSVLCEIKKIGDRLKKPQIERLNDAKKCGCICVIASQDKVTGLFKMEMWESD